MLKHSKYHEDFDISGREVDRARAGKLCSSPAKRSRAASYLLGIINWSGDVGDRATTVYIEPQLKIVVVAHGSY
eukprot:scaffold115772_cov21-Prasinocladus_malaysianus.AAC.1